MTYLFPKTLRLRKKREFHSVRSGAERTLGSFLVIDRKLNPSGKSRLGIIVSRRFGKANDRNRFKRLVREAFRLNHPQFLQGIDLIVKPRTYARHATLQDIQKELTASTR